MSEENNDGVTVKRSAEPLAAILAEMRRACAHLIVGPRVGIPGLRDILNWADRIEAAANSMRDAYCDLCQEKDAAYDRLLLERDRAFKFADAAPHPGSASWKVMQAAFRDTAELRSTMERIYRVACDAFNAPGRDLEASMSGALDTIIGAALLALGMKEADND